MTKRPRPEPVHGLRHVPAALAYSAAGFRRLWLEAAFRLELAAGTLILLAHAVLGNDFLYLAVAAVLVLAAAAAEALNTAIEVIVDHISPEWSEMAKQAKDLGSAAVFCLLVCNGVWLAYAVHAAAGG